MQVRGDVIGHLYGSDKLQEALGTQMDPQRVRVCQTQCWDHCEHAPVMWAEPHVGFTHATAKKLSQRLEVRNDGVMAKAYIPKEPQAHPSGAPAEPRLCPRCVRVNEWQTGLALPRILVMIAYFLHPHLIWLF